MLPSKQWKQLEKDVAIRLGGVRITRAMNYSISDCDVRIPGMEFLKIDSKRRKSSTHYNMWEEVKEKYCNKPGDIPVLALRVHNKRDILITIDIDFFNKLLRRWYATETNTATSRKTQSGNKEDQKS